MERSLKLAKSKMPALLALALSLPACGAPTEQEGLRSDSPAAAASGESGSVAGKPAGHDSLVAQLSAFVEDPSTVRIASTADLDNDGDLDLIAVIANRNADASDTPRTLLMLRRAANGRLERAVENKNAVLPESRGGTMGDPLRDLTARAGGFTLSFEGGSRELWSHQYSFQYAPDRDTWLLTEFKDSVLDRHDGRNEQSILSARDFGDVTVAEFDPDALATD